MNGRLNTCPKSRNPLLKRKRKDGYILRFAWVSVILLLLWTAIAAEAADRPNVVLAMADDWGWPHAGAYGDTGVKTPAFDRLAREGVLFEHAYVSSPSCSPSRGAIVTGQHFWRLEAGANLWNVWPSKFAEYPKMLAEAGYHVGSFRKAWGPGEHPDSEHNPGGKQYKSVDEFFAAREDGKPFCLWFGTSDPHRPYVKDSGEKSGIDLSKVHLFGHYPDVPEIRGDVADYYFEVQRWDSDVASLLKRLEEMGELDNTIIAMSGDHGMPFPRAKGNLYDSGARVPLAIMWKEAVPGSRTVTDFVSLTDLAPTFLEAAGLRIPEMMTGQSLVALLKSGKSGRVEADRSYALTGKERHCPAQEAPDSGGYPMRAIRTDDFLYIRNFRTDRWPAGTPNWEKAYIERAWLADADNGPTKTFLWENRDKPDMKRYYELSFGMRPEEELYDLKTDPEQLYNVADEAKYKAVRDRLWQQLKAELERSGDLRVAGKGDFYDRQKYLGGAPKFPE